MLAVLLLSAFAVLGFFSLLLSLTERCSDALAVRAKRGESEKGLVRRLSLVSRSGREVVVLLDDPTDGEALSSIGWTVYLRVSGEKGDPTDG